MTTEPILGFQGEYRFLSNFWEAPFAVPVWKTNIPEGAVRGSKGDTVMFDTNEMWYMHWKPEDRMDALRILMATSPGECKRIGRSVDLRDDWEEIKDRVMLIGLRYKFEQNPHLLAALLATGKRYLEETNTWGDRYWGVCKGSGRNMLGILLMQVRAELSQSE